mgnify:CR=1 FL=1
MPEEAPVPHTLFVRPDCKYCNLLLKEMDRGGVRAEFNVIDVSKQPTPQVSHVPCLIADHQKRMDGREACSWILNHINESPQCASQTCQWESMSNHFTFIDPNEDDMHLTNSGMSTVFTSIDDDHGQSDSLSQSQIVPDDNSQRQDPLANAMSDMQHERDTSFQMVQRT